MTDTKKLREAAERATKGPWLEREDHDYYQGGTYIGTHPFGYTDGRKDPTLSDYFERDVCRVEGTEADKQYLLMVYPQAVLSLLDELDAARGAVEMLVEALSACEGVIHAKYRNDAEWVCVNISGIASKALSHPTVQAARAK
jgi:tryptophan synthase beta subunit